jgi:hypothetical protein
VILNPVAGGDLVVQNSLTNHENFEKLLTAEQLQFGDPNFFLSPWRINNFAETDDGNCRI